MAVWREPFARAFETLAVDSVFETGQNPPLAFFFVPGRTSVDGSDWVMVTVEVEELLEDKDEEELLRWTVLRWGINMRETSSELIAEKPPPLELTPFQFSREIF